MHWMLCLSRLLILLSKHIHTFLPITFLIFNPKKVLESWGWGLFIHTINTIYVNTVESRQGSLMHSMLSMLTLSIQDKATLYRVEYSFHTSLLCIQCCAKATNTSVDSVNKHSIQCIACFDLHVDSVNKQHSIHNSIALILCIDHLDMPFNVHTTDKVTMITMSGFLTI